MANNQNLMTPEELNARLTPEERHRNAVKAGKASAQKKARLRTLKELMQIYGSMSDPDNPHRTNDEAVVVNQYKLAKSDKPGSTQAATYIRDTRGEKPHDVLETPNIEVKPLVDLTKRKKNGEKNG